MVAYGLVCAVLDYYMVDGERSGNTYVAFLPTHRRTIMARQRSCLSN
jgi:hypothetical protein